jgi:hypothetical protein
MALKRSRVRVPLGPPKPLSIPWCTAGVFISARKGIAVAKQQENPLDKLGERLREILKEIEGLLNPQLPKRERALIPVPVRTPRPPQRRNPY